MDESCTAMLNIADLVDEQRRGAACAYCALPVSTGNAVDLGERRDSDGVHLFLRAHRGCIPGGA